MKQIGRIFIATLIVGTGGAAMAAQATPVADPNGKTCRMEQQCRWQNFKKICVYVKVCR